MNYSNQIKKFILDNISNHQKDIIYTAVQRFGVSRQAVLKHMHSLINDKQVIAHGKLEIDFMNKTSGQLPKQSLLTIHFHQKE